jgi:hypothetical protein
MLALSDPTDAVTVKVPITPLEKVTVAVPPVVVALKAERLPPLGAAKTTVVPLSTGFPSDFLAVTVMVTLLPTAADDGDAVNDTPEMYVTVTLLLTTPEEAVTLQLMAEELVRVTVATPPDVVAENADNVPPTVVKETWVPSATGVPSCFLTVAVMVTEALTTGEEAEEVTVMVAGESGPIVGNQSTLPQPHNVITRTVSIKNFLPIYPPGNSRYARTV